MLNAINTRLEQDTITYILTHGEAKVVLCDPQFLPVVAAAIEAMEGARPTLARLLYLGQRSLDVTVTDVKIEAVTEQLAQTWSAVNASCESDEFEAKPGVLCGWCPFVSDCPEGVAELTRRQAAGKLPAHAPAASLVA